MNARWPADEVGKRLVQWTWRRCQWICALEFQSARCLALNGVYCHQGIARRDHPLQNSRAQNSPPVVLDNRYCGASNAGVAHFQMGADDLFSSSPRWGAHIGASGSHRYSYSQFCGVMNHQSPETSGIIEWGFKGPTNPYNQTLLFAVAVMKLDPPNMF